MSIALETKVESLRMRIEALEQAKAAATAPLRARNASRRAAGERLRQAIRQILSVHQSPTSTKRVLSALAAMGTTSKLPSLRTVQWHINAIRKTDVLR